MEQDAPSPRRTSHHSHPQPPRSMHWSPGRLHWYAACSPHPPPRWPLAPVTQAPHNHLSVSPEGTALPSYGTGVARGRFLTARAPKRWHTGSIPGRGWPRGPQAARPLAQWCCPRLPAVPPTAYLQRSPGDDPGDGDPTINCAVSLDCYRTLFLAFCIPHWHSWPQHALALNFPVHYDYYQCCYHVFVFVFFIIFIIFITHNFFMLFLFFSYLFFYYYCFRCLHSQFGGFSPKLWRVELYLLTLSKLLLVL